MKSILFALCALLLPTMANADVFVAKSISLNKPATFVLNETGDFSKVIGVVVKARPIHVEKNISFMIRVTEADSHSLLGIFSFFPAIEGKDASFAMPKPLHSPVKLMFDLIPSNPARKITDSEVEIVDVHLVYWVDREVK